jgi:hypothetical protein
MCNQDSKASGWHDLSRLGLLMTVILAVLLLCAGLVEPYC